MMKKQKVNLIIEFFFKQVLDFSEALTQRGYFSPTIKLALKWLQMTKLWGLARKNLGFFWGGGGAQRVLSEHSLGKFWKYKSRYCSKRLQ